LFDKEKETKLSGKEKQNNGNNKNGEKEEN
jgi:hypothetical protein